MNKTESQLVMPATQEALAVSSEPSTVQLLQAVIDRGITAESVGVLKDLMQMRREEISAQNKADFNRDFFALKTEIAAMDFYADKEAKDYDGNTMYRFCSETELSAKLEPVLFKHGFAMMFGQRQENERVVAEITLIHKGGHEEKREYAVRMGATNKMKDATQADAGSTTTAWRNLVIKLFGIKSRISESGDARNEGEYITMEEIQYLQETLRDVGGKEEPFLKMAGATKFSEIRKGSYAVLCRSLEMKRRAK